MIHFCGSNDFSQHYFSLFLVCNDVIKNLNFRIKFLHNVNDSILKVLCKFQVDLSINARVRTVHSLDNLHTFILRQPYWCMGKRMPTSPFFQIT